MQELYKKHKTYSFKNFNFTPNHLTINQDNIKEEWQQKEKTTLKEAENLYQDIAKASLMDKTGTLVLENKTDTASFSTAYDKASQEIADNIKDNKVKQDFYADSILKKSTFLNKIKINALKQEEEEEKNFNQNLIEKNLILSGISLNNLLSGEGNIDDLINLKNSNQENENLISKKNNKDENIFDFNQQNKLKNNIQKLQIKALSDGFKNMSALEKSNFLNDLNKDIALIPISNSESVPLKDILNENTYSLFKNRMQNATLKAKKDLESGKLNNPNIALNEAVEHLTIESVFDYNWDNLSSYTNFKGEKINKDPNLKEVIEFRNSLDEAFKSNQIDSKFYLNYIKKTNENILKSQNLKNNIPWDSGYQVILESLKKRINFKTLNTNETAFLAEQVFKNIENQGLEYTDSYYSAPKTFNEIANDVFKNYVYTQYPEQIISVLEPQFKLRQKKFKMDIPFKKNTIFDEDKE